MAGVFRLSYQDCAGRAERVALWIRTIRDVVSNGVLAHAKTLRQKLRLTANINDDRSGPMQSLLHDSRIAIRSFLRQPMFTLLAIVTLALGVGATTTIYSVVDTVLLRPLPYKDPSSLVVLGTSFSNVPGSLSSTSAPNFIDWKNQATSFASMAAVTGRRSINLIGGGEPEQVTVARVTEGFFELLGISPSLGRSFAPEEYPYGSESVALISDGLWRRRYGADAGILGQSINTSSGPVTVIGVMPADLHPPEALWVGTTGIWLPLDPAKPEYASRDGRFMRVVARLEPGVTLETAQAEMTTIGTALVAAYPEDLTFRSDSSLIAVAGLHATTVGDIGGTLGVLLGAVGLLLLIACVNVANLSLARGTDRAREMALRAALGAGGTRIAKQLLTESVILAVLGGAGGVAIAYIGVAALQTFDPGGIPRLAEVTVDIRILGFAILVSVVSGVCFGMVPAIQAARRHPGEALKEGAASVTSGRRKNLFRDALIVCETALALILLVGAGLLFNSFIRLNLVDPGFDQENVLAMRLASPDRDDVEQSIMFFDDVIARVSAIPGIVSVGSALNLPIGNVSMRMSIFPEGADFNSDPEGANIHAVNPNYLPTVGIDIIEGQDFGRQHGAGQPEVVIVNQALASKHWGRESALGKRIHIGRDPSDPWMTVIGVTANVRQAGLANKQPLEAYRPWRQAVQPWFSTIRVVAKYDGNNKAGTIAAMREAVWAVDPDHPVRVTSLEERLYSSIALPRFYTTLLGSFAVIALVLAAAGIYGSLLYSVTRRMHEVGIRMALGAEAGSILRMVVGNGMKLVIAGLAIGLAGAWGLSRLLDNLLFEVTATDGTTFVSVAVFLAAVGLMASYLPARKATKVDPISTLKTN